MVDAFLLTAELQFLANGWIRRDAPTPLPAQQLGGREFGGRVGGLCLAAVPPARAHAAAGVGGLAGGRAGPLHDHGVGRGQRTWCGASSFGGCGWS